MLYTQSNSIGVYGKRYGVLVAFSWRGMAWKTLLPEWAVTLQLGTGFNFHFEEVRG